MLNINIISIELTLKRCCLFKDGADRQSDVALSRDVKTRGTPRRSAGIGLRKIPDYSIWPGISQETWF